MSLLECKNCPDLTILISHLMLDITILQLFLCNKSNLLNVFVIETNSHDAIETFLLQTLWLVFDKKFLVPPKLQEAHYFMFSRRNCRHPRLWSGFENFTAMKSCVCPQKTILFFFLNVASLVLAHALLFCFVNFSFVDGCMVDLYACDAIYDLVRARLGICTKALSDLP